MLVCCYFFIRGIIHERRRVVWFNAFLIAINDSVFIKLNITSHVFAQDMMVLRSMLILIPVRRGSSMIS